MWQQVFRLTVILLSGVSLLGCDRLPWNPMDLVTSEETAESLGLRPSILLDIAVPTLSDGASFYDERTDPEQEVFLRRRTWRGPPGNDVSASLVEVRRLDGTPFETAAPQPQESVKYWDRLKQRVLTFHTLYQSRNAIGPVLWQRFTMGSSVCVLFAQGWGAVEGEVSRYIAGYYCAASGNALTDGHAGTVVRAVRVREGDPSDAADG